MEPQDDLNLQTPNPNPSPDPLQDPRPVPKTKTWLIIVIIAVLLLIGGGLAYYFLSCKKTNSPSASEEEGKSSQVQGKEQSSNKTVALTKQVCGQKGVCVKIPENWTAELVDKNNCGQFQPCQYLKIYDDKHQITLLDAPAHGLGGGCPDAVSLDAKITVLDANKTPVESYESKPVYVTKSIIEYEDKISYLLGLTPKPDLGSKTPTKPINSCAALLLTDVVIVPKDDTTNSRKFMFVMKDEEYPPLQFANTFEEAEKALTTERANTAFQILSSLHLK